jgi:hypothetical protein
VKTAHLQIRLSPPQKAALKRRAARAGQDLSTYVLQRVLPSAASDLQHLIDELAQADVASFGLAAIHDLLTGLGPAELSAAVEGADLHALPPLERNQLAAMVEQATHGAGVPPPAWCGDVEPLAMPWFAAPLRSLRPHLLRASPVAFRRRNLFVDTTLGGRV